MGRAGLLEGGGPLASFRPLLPPICQMALAHASSAVVASADLRHGSSGGGEAALVLALTAVRRVTASLSDAVEQQNTLDMLQLSLDQAGSPPRSMSSRLQTTLAYVHIPVEH